MVGVGCDGVEVDRDGVEVGCDGVHVVPTTITKAMKISNLQPES